eukprot:COSAG04_NODE_3047_length_3239_cov_2.317834_2_plen_58_part_00
MRWWGEEGAEAGEVEMGRGDVFSVAAGLCCGLEAGAGGGRVFCVVAADAPAPVRWRP